MKEPIDDIPEPDRREGAPHPRETDRLFGQSAAEQDILQALRSDRLHHAWLIAGPEGIGKATLAWRFARHLIAREDGGSSETIGFFGGKPEAPDSLDLAPDHPVARRVAALSEPGLFLLRRPWDLDRKRLRQEITVDAARKLHPFFGLSSSSGGRRVVIVDAADELNSNAANALLKLIEEPPANCTLLLVCHRPSAVLPTIRSRCRLLRCQPLGQEDLLKSLEAAGATLPEDAKSRQRLWEIAGGSAGFAWDLLALEGLALDAEVRAIFKGLPGPDRRATLSLAERLSPAKQAPVRRLFYRLVFQEIAQLARAAAGAEPSMPAPRPSIIAHHCAALLWAEAHQELGARMAHGEAVNLDPQNLILDMVRKIDEVATRAAAG
ncbi:MAG: DNA polymerase III subunit delta' [Pseudomonadota bacterium]